MKLDLSHTTLLKRRAKTNRQSIGRTWLPYLLISSDEEKVGTAKERRIFRFQLVIDFSIQSNAI